MTDFDDEIAALKSAGLFRSLRTVVPVDGGHLLVDGREVVSFAGNDYLGLRRHPSVVAAATAGLQ